VAEVYISSTYSDLEECRNKVRRALERMQHRVIAMEDYGARDDRPLAKCLADVERCHVYIGIFAWRYGYVPAKDNPGLKSITELELRHAREKGKPCLLFLIDEKAPWPMARVEREVQERVWSLRRELCEEKTISFFDSAEDLAAKVSAAIHNWEIENLGEREPAASRPPAAPPQREVSHHALLAYAAADEPFALQISRRLGRDLLLHPTALFAGQSEDLQALENAVRQCHTAVVVLSDPTLVELQQEAERSRRVLGMLRSRTGHLVFLCRSEGSLARAAEWGPAQAIDARGWGAEPNGAQIAELDRAVAAGWRRGLTGTVGLPFVVVAMTESEARQLAQAPELLERDLGTESYRRFLALAESLKSYGTAPWTERYGPRREDWRPFLGSSRTAGEVIGEVVDRLNDLAAPLQARAIKVQHYPFDPLVEKDALLRGVYDEIGRTGCVVLVDELSMFHPQVRASLLASPLADSALATLVTISPFDPYGMPVNEMLETELRRRLDVAFARYMDKFDPLCEFGVGSEQRLKRWFHGSLPEALRNLRSPGPDRGRLASFALKVAPPDPVDGTELVFRSGKSF
jgi:uncharacterized protein DUF4062